MGRPTPKAWSTPGRPNVGHPSKFPCQRLGVIVNCLQVQPASMDECCAVCAEPIQFIGYGPCGHKEACSKCVVRLRVVLHDQRCVICQQEHDSVFITKYMGDYTQTLAAAAFSELPVGVTACWKLVPAEIAELKLVIRTSGQGTPERAISPARCQCIF